MGDSADAVPHFRVLRQYDNSTTRNIWRAFGRAREEVKGGRERLADAVAEVMADIKDKAILFPDGEPYLPGDAPTPETFANFLRSGRAHYESLPAKRGGSFRVKDETLRYIHAYLWGHDMKIADTLDRGVHAGHIGQMVSAFGPRAPHLILPEPFRLLTEKSRLRYGVIYFVAGERAVESRCFYADCGHPDVLADLPRSDADRSRVPAAFRAGHAVLVEAHEYRHDDHYGPATPLKEHIISVELDETEDHEGSFVSLHIPDFFILESSYTDPVRTSSIPARMQSRTYSGGILIDPCLPAEIDKVNETCSKL